MVGVSSSDFFYYPNFFTPFWEIGLGYKFDKNLLLNLSTDIVYSDMFTLTGFIDAVVFKLTLCWFLQ